MNSIIAFLRRRPETEARRSCGSLRMRARDERTVCAVERVRSRGGRGRTGNPWNAVKPCVGHGGPARDCLHSAETIESCSADCSDS